jgi:imidazole glycerol-phosphate synthase subunit HisH
MRVAIVRYNAGNIASVGSALTRLGVKDIAVTDQADELRTADRVIFPGVGEASSAMQHLRERRLDSVIRKLKQPVLGICLGMQLLCSSSEENDTEGIGVFSAAVRRLPPGVGKVPHVGWNTIEKLSSPIFKGIDNGEYVYFVHGYAADDAGNASIAQTTYGVSFAAALAKDNFFAVQFHPEKSGRAGDRILENFLNL